MAATIPKVCRKINIILRDWRRNEPTKMDPRLLDLVWEAYRESGATDYIQVVCGYRSPSTNSMLRSRSRGVAEKSQHMLGKAMDFYIPGVPLKKLRNIGLKMQGGGVGYYPTSGSPFVHMDVGNVRHWPGISRQELVSVFPNGKTLHVPSDGRPLPGYEQALAAYKSRRRFRRSHHRAGQRRRRHQEIRRFAGHPLRWRFRRGRRQRRCRVGRARSRAQDGTKPAPAAKSSTCRA